MFENNISGVSLSYTYWKLVINLLEQNLNVLIPGPCFYVYLYMKHDKRGLWYHPCYHSYCNLATIFIKRNKKKRQITCITHFLIEPIKCVYINCTNNWWTNQLCILSSGWNWERKKIKTKRKRLVTTLHFEKERKKEKKKKG